MADPAAPTGYLHTLTAEEKQKLDDFQAMVDAVIKQTQVSRCWYVDLNQKGDPRDIVLLKFLRATQFDLDKAKDRLEATLEWRRDVKAEETGNGQLWDCFAGHDFNEGTDRNNNPISGCRFSNMDIDKVFGDEEAFVRYRVLIMENAIKRISWKRGEPELICSIHDYEGMSLFQPAHVKACIKAVSTIMADHYPEFKARSLFLNFQKGFVAAFNAFSVFMPAQTRAKMLFIATGDYTSLYEVVRPNHIPKEMGGFGPWLEGNKDLSSVDGTHEAVPAWGSVIVDGPSGSEIVTKKVAYQIRVMDGDLEWKIQVVNDAGEVLEDLAEQIEPRLQEEDGTIQGVVEPTKEGKLVLHLMNNFAYWGTKTVIWRIASTN